VKDRDGVRVRSLRSISKQFLKVSVFRIQYELAVVGAGPKHVGASPIAVLIDIFLLAHEEAPQQKNSTIAL